MAAIKAVPSQNFLQKTLDAALLTGVTASVTLNNTTGIQNLPGVFIVDRVDTNNVETPSKRETVGFTAVSGSTLTTLSRGLAGSSDQDHSVGAIVEFAADVVWAQSIYDALTETVTASTGSLDTSKIAKASGATMTALSLNFGSLASGSMYFEQASKVNRLALGATNSFLVAMGSQPAWYYASGASGAVLTSTGTGLPVYSPPSSSSAGSDGWVSSSDTWTFASADSPSFTFTIAGVDRTTTLYAGMKVKLTQTSAKYFIITKVAFSTDTTVTIYGGTDYTLANAAITSPNYSTAKSPAGFPMDPSKWTLTFSDTSDRTQASPSDGTWYNLGTSTLAIHTGVWQVFYECILTGTKASSSGQIYLAATLSTANNSESQKAMSSYFRNVTGATTNVEGWYTARREQTLVLTSKTSYYLNASSVSGSIDSVNFKGASGTTLIQAVCAYL